jgi:hypothetical protein
MFLKSQPNIPTLLHTTPLRLDLSQIGERHDNKTNPRSEPTKSNQPLQFRTTAFLLHFYSFFYTSAPYRPATHPATATATPPRYHDVFPTSVGPRDLGRRIRFIGTPTPSQIRSRSNDTPIRQTTQRYAGHIHPLSYLSQSSNHLGLIHPHLGLRIQPRLSLLGVIMEYSDETLGIYYSTLQSLWLSHTTESFARGDVCEMIQAGGVDNRIPIKFMHHIPSSLQTHHL